VVELQFLPDGSADCPLIRFAGNDSAAYTSLRNAFVELSLGSISEVDLDRLPGIVPIEACRVSAIAAKWDQGVVPTGIGNEFKWRLTPNTWDNVAALLEPFCSDDSSTGYQWIESAGDMHVLITHDGKW
jgi:hypothetical protein